MAEKLKGVFPVYNIGILIALAGETEPQTKIKDLETMGISIDGNVENWTPFDTAGWARSLMTGKAFSIEFSGKRNIGDPGNDYVADMAWKDGLDCSTKMAIEFPNGAKLTFDCVINVTNVGGGDSTNVAPLEFTAQGDGKPTWTPATPTA